MPENIIPNSDVQAGFILKLKNDAPLVTSLTVADGEGEKGIKEDQFQGDTFKYPAVRVDIQRQEPKNQVSPCILSSLFLTVRVYAEGTSSKPCDDITALVVKALHKQDVLNSPATFKIPEVLYNSMLGAIRTDDRLWMGVAIFTGNIYPPPT